MLSIGYQMLFCQLISRIGLFPELWRINMSYYGYAIFEPEFFEFDEEDTCWAVHYYRCYNEGYTPAPSQSFWIVPGTLEF